MLLELKIKNFLLIKDCHLSFDRGFTVFTGETGAGKSLLIKALKLILGEKGQATYLRPRAEIAEIEALFYVGKDLAQKLAEMGFSPTEELHIKRILSSTKQRAFLNGSPISLSELQILTRELISITSQHEHYTFFHRDNQIKFLDELIGLKEKVNQYQELFKNYLALKKKMKTLEDQIKEATLKREYLLFQLSELEDLKPNPEEEAELLKLRERLKHLSQLKMLLQGLKETLELSSANLSQALNYLQKLIVFEPSLEERKKNLETLYYEIVELEREIFTLEHSLPEDESELNWIEERLAKYERLKRKHGKDTQGLVLTLAELKRELALLETGEEELEKLSTKLKNLEKEILELAFVLSAERKRESQKLEKLILQELKNLGMEKASFEVAIRSRESISSFLTPYGLDEVEFLFTSNPGLPLKPLEKIVSGGELSRIYLAFRSLLREKKGFETLIFDEVDTGIGGETAIKVGEKLKNLSQEVQIICITHLPQIARFADHHFVVEKVLGERESKTLFRKVQGEDRLKELARMLGDVNNLELAQKFLAGKP